MMPAQSDCGCSGAHLWRRMRSRSLLLYQDPHIPFSRIPSVCPAASGAPEELSGLNIQEHSLRTFCKDQAGFQVCESYLQFTSSAAGDAGVRLN